MSRSPAPNVRARCGKSSCTNTQRVQEHPQHQQEAGNIASPLQPCFELQLTCRVQNATQKVDSIIAENPGVSLDELAASRKINADQKAQALRKPKLQAELAQLEEQIAQYKKFDQEYQEKHAREKELLQKSHSGELEALRETLKAEAAIEQKNVFREKILTLSRFLRAAAARRQLEDDNSELTKAFEGALLQVYGGDAVAVSAAEKLIEGADDGVPSTEGVLLSTTCT